MGHLPKFFQNAIFGLVHFTPIRSRIRMVHGATLLGLGFCGYAHAAYQPETSAWEEHPKPMEVIRYSPGMKPFISSHWFGGIEGGAHHPISNSILLVPSHSEFSRPSDRDTYTTNKSTRGFIGLSAGRIWERNTRWWTAFSIALRYRYLFPTNLGGSISQYSLPNFNNYQYSWKVTSNVVTAQSKLNIAQYGKLSPYVGVGIGIASNDAQGYSEKANPGITPRTSPGFASNTNNKFTYNIGAGVDINYSPQLLFTVGYDYQNLGTVSSGYGNKTWSEDSLNLGRFAVNSLFVGATYLVEALD